MLKYLFTNSAIEGKERPEEYFYFSNYTTFSVIKVVKEVGIFRKVRELIEKCNLLMVTEPVIL